MLSIQAVRGLPRLRAPGTVSGRLNCGRVIVAIVSDRTLRTQTLPSMMRSVACNGLPHQVRLLNDVYFLTAGTKLLF